MALRLTSFILLCLIAHVVSQECRTVSKPSLKIRRLKIDKPCVFPFLYKGNWSDGCRESKRFPGNYFCATKVYENGTNVNGELGICSNECDRECPEHKSCMSADQCPLYQKFSKLKNKQSQEYRDIDSELRKSVCNKKLRRLCCDNPVGSQDGDDITAETQVTADDYLRPIFPEACNENPGQGFNGTALPRRGQCGITCNRLATVIGGKNAELGEFPWAALLGYTIRKRVWNVEIQDFQVIKTVGWKCGGTLINSWYVLTAAHCVQGKNGKRNKHLVKVKLGELTVGNDPDCPNVGGTRDSLEDCLPPVQEIDVGNVTIHKDYNKKLRGEDKGFFFDIALIRLKTEATLNRAVQFTCLPFPDTADIIGATNFGDDLDGQNATVIGWGQIANYDAGDFALYTVSEKDLQKLKVPVISHQECRQLFNGSGYLITEKHLCAGGNIGEDSCKGDSGGGLFIQSNVSTFQNPIRPFVQIGVVSFGSQTCGVGTPTVFTKVTQFIQWIQQHLEP